jgi:Mg-chelatase subunit ChlI
VEWVRGALDPIVSPQLATVATMLLVAVFVLTNTVSTDGSVGGIYAATLQLAHRTADKATKSSVLPDGVRKFQGSVDNLMGNDNASEGDESPKNQNQNENQVNQNSNSQNSQSKPRDNSQSKAR